MRAPDIFDFPGSLMLDRRVPHSTQTSALMHMHERHTDQWYAGPRFGNSVINDTLWPMVSELCYLIPRMIPRDVFFRMSHDRQLPRFHDQKLVRASTFALTHMVDQEQFRHTWSDIALMIAERDLDRTVAARSTGADAIIYTMGSLVMQPTKHLTSGVSVMLMSHIHTVRLDT